MALEWLFLLIGTTMGTALSATGWILYQTLLKRSWPIQVPILRQRGDTVVWKLNQRARKKKLKNNTEVLQLRKSKKSIRPPKSSDLGVDEKGKPVYPIYMTGSGNFPINIRNPKLFDVQIDTGARNWIVQEIGHTAEKYAPHTSTFMQLLPYLMSGTFAAMVIFFTIFYGGKMELVANSMSNAANSLAQAMAMYKGP